MARKLTPRQQWAMKMIAHTQEHPETHFSARDLVALFGGQLDEKVKRQIEIGALAQEASRLFAAVEDEDGARVMGSFTFFHPDTGQRKNVWKPFDVMRSSFIYESVNELKEGLKDHAAAVGRTIRKCNRILESRGDPLIPTALDVIETVVVELDANESAYGCDHFLFGLSHLPPKRPPRRRRRR